MLPNRQVFLPDPVLGHVICREMHTECWWEIGKKETTWKTLARWEDNIEVYLKE